MVEKDHCSWNEQERGPGAELVGGRGGKEGVPCSRRSRFVHTEMATRKPPSEVEVTRFIGVLLSMMGSAKGTREGKMTENQNSVNTGSPGAMRQRIRGKSSQVLFCLKNE